MFKIDFTDPDNKSGSVLAKAIAGITVVADDASAPPASTTPPVTTPSEPVVASDNYVTVSADHYGDPTLMSVSVDGVLVVENYGVKAIHDNGAWENVAIPGQFDLLSSHKVEVAFLNDGWDFKQSGEGHDRNLFVKSVTLGKQTKQVPNGLAALMSDGVVVVLFGPDPTVPPVTTPPADHDDPARVQHAACFDDPGGV
jgi:hypothetical protein